ALARLLREDAPPLARVERVDAAEAEPTGSAGFAIVESDVEGARRALPPPDAGPCPDCLDDLRDPGGRRRRYPFVNCTACGPRLSVVRALPYDRARTTMARFPLCDPCRREYEDPSSRRFHAEPTACPRCGPRLAFEPGAEAGEAALAACVAALREGRVVAGQGGGRYQPGRGPRDRGRGRARARAQGPRGEAARAPGRVGRGRGRPYLRVSRRAREPRVHGAPHRAPRAPREHGPRARRRARPARARLHAPGEPAP